MSAERKCLFISRIPSVSGQTSNNAGAKEYGSRWSLAPALLGLVESRDPSQRSSGNVCSRPSSGVIRLSSLNVPLLLSYSCQFSMFHSSWQLSTLNVSQPLSYSCPVSMFPHSPVPKGAQTPRHQGQYDGPMSVNSQSMV